MRVAMRKRLATNLIASSLLRLQRSSAKAKLSRKAVSCAFSMKEGRNDRLRRAASPLLHQPPLQRPLPYELVAIPCALLRHETHGVVHRARRCGAVIPDVEI